MLVGARVGSRTGRKENGEWFSRNQAWSKRKTRYYCLLFICGVNLSVMIYMIGVFLLHQLRYISMILFVLLLIFCQITPIGHITPARMVAIRLNHDPCELLDIMVDGRAFHP